MNSVICFQDAGYWGLVTGRWSLVACHWSLELCLMNGFDYILLFFDRIYRIYWIFYNWHKAATIFWYRNFIKKQNCEVFLSTEGGLGFINFFPPSS